MGLNKFQKPIERIGLMGIRKNKNSKGEYYLSYTLIDSRDLKTLERQLQKIYPARISFIVIELNIYADGSHQVLKISQKKYFKVDFRYDYVAAFKIVHSLRYLLSTKRLDAYIMHNYIYQKIPPEFWHDDWNWYRLLADCSLCGNIPSIGDAHGCVYFKKEDVDHCLSSNFDEQQDKLGNSSSLINLDIYTTPWLQVQAAIYDEYGKDGLAQAAKESIVLFIKECIEKHKLDIADTDIPFLAKFMRLAEQKEGKKYHAKQKLQQLYK